MKEFLQNLEEKIQRSYQGGVTMEEAEKLAAEFLNAQLQVSKALTKVDMDSRQRKSGLKAVRAAIYKEILSSNDKKPTEAAIAASIDSDALVTGQQTALDEAECSKAELERYYDVFQHAHVFYRGVAKAAFNG